jgi:hypothetical protein
MVACSYGPLPSRRSCGSLKATTQVVKPSFGSETCRRLRSPEETITIFRVNGGDDVPVAENSSR